MKNKMGMLALILSILCVCMAGTVCLMSYLKIKEADKQMADLEAKIQNLESRKAEGVPENLETESSAGVDAVMAETGSTESDQMPQTEIVSQTEMVLPMQKENGYTVALDPGHQGHWIDMSEMEASAPGSGERKAKATTGTQGMYSGIPEYELNLDISLALRTELESRGYRVVLTREDNDTAISNAERAIKAYEEGGDIYVRIHANGSEDSSVKGALGMTPSYENVYVGNLAEDSYRLTECILNSYCEQTSFLNLGIQYHDDMTGINWSRIPVMILEMGFMTNEQDDLAMADEAVREKMVLGIANGIDQYFGR